MRFRPADYMVWAKRMAHDARVRYGLAASNCPHLKLEELGLEPGELELAGEAHYGWPPLREAVAARHGVDPACVALAAGTTCANLLCLGALVERGAPVLFEEPCYTPLRRTAEWLEAEIRPLPRPFERGFAPDLDALEDGFRGGARLAVMTNLHNPSGVRLGREALEAMAAIARRHGARVLVDEVYREFVFDGSEPPAFAVAPDVFCSTSGFSKVHGLAELRFGFLLATPEVVERALYVYDIVSVENAHPSDRLALAAYRRMERILARSRAAVEARMPLLRAFVEGRRDLAWARPAGGFMGFPRLPGGADGRAFSEALLARERTLVVPGDFFGAPAHVRVAAALEPADLAEALARLGRALDALAS